MYALKPRTRRIVYVITFEVLAILLSTVLLMMLSGGPAQGSLPVAAAISVIALIWNYLFSLMFESWERRNNISKRTVGLRVAHAAGFELGLCLFTVPLYMLWYQVGFIEAMVMEMAILIFFFFYTFVFAWVFDMVFMLPQHVRTNCSL